MPRNNKGTIIFGSSTDKARKAKDRIAAAKRVQQNRYEATKEDLKKTIELMYSQKEYIKEIRKETLWSHRKKLDRN